MKLLIAEDDPNLCRFFSRILVRAGYTVDACSRGDEALAKVRSGAADILVLDWKLPGLDGIEVLRNLRAEGHSLPVLILSGGDDDARRQALNCGADGFLPKPCGLEELTQEVSKYAGRILARSLFQQAA